MWLFVIALLLGNTGWWLYRVGERLDARRDGDIGGVISGFGIALLPIAAGFAVIACQELPL